MVRFLNLILRVNTFLAKCVICIGPAIENGTAELCLVCPSLNKEAVAIHSICGPVEGHPICPNCYYSFPYEKQNAFQQMPKEISAQETKILIQEILDDVPKVGNSLKESESRTVKEQSPDDMEDRVEDRKTRSKKRRKEIQDDKTPRTISARPKRHQSRLVPPFPQNSQN